MSIYYWIETCFQTAIQSNVVINDVGVLHMRAIAYFTHDSDIEPLYNKAEFWNLKYHPWLKDKLFILPYFSEQDRKTLLESPVSECFK